MTTREQLIQLVKSIALQIKPEGEFFTLKSGKQSRFYLDLRKLTLNAPGLKAIIDQILSRSDLAQVIGKVQAIGGPCVGADPIVGGMLLRLAMVDATHRGFLVRPAPKDHGNPERVIGSIQPGDQCLLLEDVTTTGQSSLDAIDAITAFGATVVHVISVVDRSEGAAGAFNARSIPFTPLLHIDDVL